MTAAQSVDNVRVGNEEVGARRRLAPTGSALRVKPDGAQGPWVATATAPTRLARRYQGISDCGVGCTCSADDASGARGFT
jgi:hypothetical protein